MSASRYHGMIWAVVGNRVVVYSEDGFQIAARQSTCSVDADAAWAEGWIDGHADGRRTGVEIGGMQQRLKVREALGFDEDLRELRIELRDAIAELSKGAR